ncbi:MAG: hypothetical protein AVDCRST_MAG38-409, partial [uncultured Solirubrobacteraceae bacterium]
GQHADAGQRRSARWQRLQRKRGTKPRVGDPADRPEALEPPPSRRDAVPRRGGRVLLPVDRAVVHRQPPGRSLRRALGPLHPRRRCLLDGGGEAAM